MRKGFLWTATLSLSVLTACGDDASESSGSTTVTDDASESSGSTTVTDDSSESSGSTTVTDAPSDGTEAGEACPGTVGCVPADQPDVNGGGVVIGVLSPGDTNDGGYYESFVAAARDYGENQGWEVIVADRVDPGDAAESTRNLCRQDADLVAIADIQLQDALPVASEEACSGTIFYVATGEGLDLDGTFFLTGEDVVESQVTAGYATGLVMRELGVNKAGFIGGPELDFVNQSYDAWTSGIALVVADATFVKTLTGDFDDAALGQEAAKSQIAEGAGIIYPYLGGATDATTSAAFEEGVLAVAAGTDRCAQAEYAVSSLFSPGDYFRAALERLSAGEVVMGEQIIFRVGVDDVSGAKICEAVPNAALVQAELDEFEAHVASGKVDTDAVASGDS